MAADYNEFVAEATNRQTVINILRARSREPLHFTRFAKMLGTAAHGGQRGAQCGRQRDQPRTGRAGQRVRQQPAHARRDQLGAEARRAGALGYRLRDGINATDDLWKGITTSVASAKNIRLLRQGREPDVVSYLIQRIDFVGRILDAEGTVVDTLPLGHLLNQPISSAATRPSGIA